MDELIEISVRELVKQGFSEEQARAHMRELLPTLDYWKRYEELSDDGQFEAFKQQLSEKFGAEYIGTGDGYNSVLVRFDHTMTLEEIGKLVDQIREAFPGCSAKHRDPTIFA
jgi:hypothetical protein